MAETVRTRVLVVGGGPGGYVAAIRAGQLGLDTVLVEGSRLGGTCLIRGCIPSKALIHGAEHFRAMAAAVGGSPLGIALDRPPRLDLPRMIAWKDGIVDRLADGVAGLLAGAKVRVVEGWARFTDAKRCTVETANGAVAIAAEHVILATGSQPVPVSALRFGGAVISSTEALSLARLPEHLIVLGAGYIGLELGTAFRKLGARVSIVEAADRILPRYDEALTMPVRRWLDQAGVALHLQATAIGPASEGGIVIESRDGERKTLLGDAVLVTVGRRPLLEGWGFEEMGVDLDRGCIKIDDQCRTTMRNVWAIGDVTGEPMLAHRASAQGEMVAEIIAGRRRRFAPAAIPAICFTDPEIVTAGLSPEMAAADGEEPVTVTVSFAANGRALTLEGGRLGGFVRLVARRDDHRLLGIQAVGAQISELAGEFAHALEMGAVLEDLAGTIHAHPTLGESLGEAARRGLGRLQAH